jgi:hypothetical protein
MYVDDKTYVINSEISLKAFYPNLNALFKAHKYITLTWRIGEDRSLDQNALFHVFCSIAAAYYLKKDRKQVSEGELAGMKRVVKKDYYNETGKRFMVHEVINPKMPTQKKTDYTSSSSWKTGEMFNVLTFMQDVAALDGLVLESTGQFKKLQKETIS